MHSNVIISICDAGCESDHQIPEAKVDQPDTVIESRDRLLAAGLDGNND